MKSYEATFLEPHEVDVDSPSGEGDHAIIWERRVHKFEAADDKTAKVVVSEMLEVPWKFSYRIRGLQYRSLEQLTRVTAPVVILEGTPKFKY